MAFFFEYGLALCAILLFASLAGLMSEKAGVVNIGIEGMMTFGALFVAIIGATLNDGSSDSAKSNYNQIWVVLLAGLATGAFAMLHAFPSIILKSNQVVSGTAINILALGLGTFFATSKIFGDQATSISSAFTQINVVTSVPFWLIIALVVALVVFLFFKFTKSGTRYAMVGENPNAVDAAGISVVKYRYIAVFISGVLAGIAGGVMLTTIVLGGNFGGSTLGYGFLAMGIMIFGQWKIQYVGLGVILFALMFTFGAQIWKLVDVEWLRTSSIIFNAIPFALTIVVMVIFAKKSKAPAAVGVPFDKSKR
ncbi:ABC transporter permease [Mesoplasma photuris]|uniref:ABC transporter permease n=1 Tax=Mesoplasma photuris TaxID=217731 RepID=UPI0004E187F3|nr:ABC transporter permease [Mesoplasma photuris]